MAITNVVLESLRSLPCVGGGFVHEIVAECDLATDAVDSLAPILAAAGIAATGSRIIGVREAGTQNLANGGAALTPTTDGAGHLQYRLHTDGVAGSTGPAAPVAGARLRVTVIA
jgi:hypothetical protein